MRRDVDSSFLLDCILAGGQIGARMDVNALVLGGTLTLGSGTPPIQVLDCNGAARTVLLPPEAKGLFILMYNKSGGAFALTVKEDSNTTTIGTVNQSKGALFFCDGTTWYVLAGA